MREIEIKARVKNFSDLVKKVEQFAKLSEPIHQKDTIFTRGDKSGDVGSVFVRIREETRDGKTKNLFTLKKMVNGYGDKIECETEIANANEMLRAIFELDFELYCVLKKSRRTAKIDEFEICLDEVEKLGEFVEIEKIAPDDADHDEIVAKLWEFAGQFGIAETDAVKLGYDVLLKQEEEK
jgi:adenylate cyclase class 2